MRKHHIGACVLSLMATLAGNAVAGAETGRPTSSGSTSGYSQVLASRSAPLPPTTTRDTKRAGTAMRATEYAEMIDIAAERNGVPADLVRAIILGQSAYDPRAVSSRGARGLMQLMLSTAAKLGVTDPFDPRSSIEAGTRHLRAMMDRFRDDLPRALTAYGSDEATAERYGSNVPDVMLRTYVIRVLSMYQTVARERERVEASRGTVPAAPLTVVSAGDRSILWRYVQDERTTVYTNIERPGRPAD